MGRPAMPIGTHGTIRTMPIGKSFEARTRFRDFDGRTKQLRASGRTKGIAEATLKARIRDRAASGKVFDSGSRVEGVIDAWLIEVEESSDLSPNTKRVYRHAVDNHVRPALGQLFLAEVDVPAVNRCLRKVRDTAGRGAAKTTRSVISGVLALAVRSGAMPANPAREAISLPAERRSATRALTRSDVEQLHDALRGSRRAVELDIPDLVDWMLYTGCRIGEALALRAEVLDLEHGTWEVNATVIRLTGHGLHIQRRTKTDAGWRVLALPPGAVEMLRRRRGEARLRAPDGIVFGSPAARRLRDPSNTSADLKLVFSHVGCETCHGHAAVPFEGALRWRPCLGAGGDGFRWMTSHTLRKTVATRLDEAGVSARAIADQLGHAKPSMTQDVYMGRNVVNAAAAQLLDR